ncbi:DUF6311 domain-containing protein [Rickettsiella endosymbiont of Miltochrista miniata]|uniref:DUF6311 domain-containing protein n=1 Tax=Rickettsiella endosymbiont of Miltochrista miniata TaxID=3066239 RepID=UPI00313C5440
MNKSKSNYQLFIPILVGTTAFIIVTGGKILWPNNLNWLFLNVDTADALYAWQFYRNTPIFQNPLGANFPYGMGMGGALIYAEPLFIFALPFKIISSLLPTSFQYEGLWILLCFILQGIFSWKLLEKITNDSLIIFFGCIFFVFSPPLIWRLHASIPFLGHWLILAAILFYFSSKFKKYAWPMLLMISSLVHPYFLIILVVLWGADILNRWLFKEQDFLKFLKYIIVTVLVLFLTISQAGYLILHSGFEGPGLGIYRINLLSLIDPTDGLGFTSWSHILRNQPKITGEFYEGFVYLGLGMIILSLFALAKLIHPKNFKIIFCSKRIISLLCITFLLFMYSLSTHIAFGKHELFEYQLPRIFSIFRVSARMALPFYYLIYLGIFYLIVKGYKNSISRILIFISLVFQIADSSAIYKNFKTTLSYSAPYISPLKSKIWIDVAKKYKKIIYVFPEFNYNLLSLIHYAAFNKLNINIGYFARIDYKQLKKSKDNLLNTFLSGRLDKDAIYIINDSPMRKIVSSIKMNTFYKVVKTDGFYILLPNAHGVSTRADRVDWLDYKQYEYGTKIFFRQDINNNFKNYLILNTGWSFPEDQGIWTDGNNANFFINLPKKTYSNLILTIEALPFLCLKHPTLTVDILANHNLIGHLYYKLDNLSNIKKIIISKNLIKDVKILNLEFILKKPIAPNEVSLSSDARRLGLFFSWISFDEYKMDL